MARYGVVLFDIVPYRTVRVWYVWYGTVNTKKLTIIVSCTQQFFNIVSIVRCLAR